MQPAYLQSQLENVAINDVLPLKATRSAAIGNLKCFLGLQDTSYLNSMVSFTFITWRHLIRLASAPFTSSCLANFGWVRLPCTTPGNKTEHRIYGGWVKTHVLFKPFVDQSLHMVVCKMHSTVFRLHTTVKCRLHASV